MKNFERPSKKTGELLLKSTLKNTKACLEAKYKEVMAGSRLLHITVMFAV